MRKLKILITLGAVLLPAGAALAAEAPEISPGDTAWLLVSTALVMLMTPGLAFFYGGMVRSKNVLGTIMHSFMMLCMVSLIWILWGYSLAFGPDVGGLVGSLAMVGLRGVGMEANGTVPHYIFMMFQGMFAVITPALITGAFAERMKFSAMLLFSALWVTFVYSPVAHWVWGGGWIMTKVGALDFAGGTVVHINSAVAAFVAALVVGKRKGYLEEQMMPHNLPLTVLGAALLWFGWFGFNAGSALASNGLASLAFVTTNTGAAAAAMGWSFTEWLHRGKATAFGAVSGAVAGLVGITPAAGFVSPLSAIAIGVGAGVLCYIAVNLRPRLGYDDSLDVLGIHGVGGLWGAIATGLFAAAAFGGTDGLFHGNPGLVGAQLIASAATIAYSGVVSFILLKVVDAAVGLRVSEEHERQGLDLSQHGETGYDMR
ncbi:MAG: ammonium transporter [Nitrospirota bacterium]|jgi:Amt family ammonium transporter